MSWETTGTVTVTNNSATVTGSGTLFTVKSRVGDAFIGPDGALYEIVNIVSNTVLSISPTYKGVTGSAKAYKIAPVRGYQKLSADRLYTIVNTIGDAVEVVTDLPTWLKAKQPTPVSAGGTGAETQLAARQNLGLKGAAVLDIGTAAGTVAAGDDARLTDSREWTAGTIPQAEVEAGTATTRRAFTSQRLRQGITAWFTGISGAIGRTILGRSTAAEVRGDLGLGTAATRDALDEPSSGNLSLLLTGNSYGLGGSTLDAERSPEGFARSLRTKKFALAGSGYEVTSSMPVGVAIGSGGANFSSTFGGVYAALNERRAFVYNLYSGETEPRFAEILTTINLQQATGSSTDFPMSQKAITDTLNTKAPSSHTHPWSQVTGQPATATRWPTFAEVTGKPATYAPSAHTHPVSQVTGLGTAATANIGIATGDVLTVGARGLGNVNYPEASGFEGFKASFFSNTFTSGASGVHFPSTWPSGFVWSNGTNKLSNSTSGLIISNTGNRIGFFTGFGTTSSELPPLMEIYHSGNTTKNPDGTLKASSPVINLYTEKHDLHNEEQFGATPTVSRKSKGVYEITGTLGLRSEGWYLDTPSDRNGNKYFNIEWTQNITPDAVDGVVDGYRDDIVVTIETFERVWNKDTGMFENGSPIDINDFQDRFVQLRFNELKVEQEELEDDLL